MSPAAVFRVLLRTGLGSVFVFTGFQKLLAPAENFAAVIETFEIVRGAPAQALARTLPWLEFVAGALFALGLWTRASASVLWAMNTVFIGVLAQALWRRLPIEQCGCFGEAVSLSPLQMLAVDAGLWALFLFFFATRNRVEPLSLDKHFNA